MYAILLVVLAILALGAAKNLPTLAVLGIVSLLAIALRKQAAANAAQLLALGGPQDPWATPSADARRIMRRGLKLTLSRTELASCFPGRGL